MTRHADILADDEIARQLAGMPDWRLVDDSLPGEHSGTRKALHRNFRFASFERAIGFMYAAMPHISRIDHHPRWENMYDRVDVRISTGDAGHQVTPLDIDLAIYLDRLYSEWR